MRVDLRTGEFITLKELRMALPTRFPEEYEDRCVREFWEARTITEKSTGRKLLELGPDGEDETPGQYYEGVPAADEVRTYRYGWKGECVQLRGDQVETTWPQREKRLAFEKQASDDGLTRAEQLRRFLDFYTECEELAPGFLLVSDNPGFDVPRIGFELAMELQEMPLEYRRYRAIDKKTRKPVVKTKYRTAICGDDVARGVVLHVESVRVGIQRMKRKHA
jgi:hypothetical protein